MTMSDVQLMSPLPTASISVSTALYPVINLLRHRTSGGGQCLHVAAVSQSEQRTPTMIADKNQAHKYITSLLLLRLLGDAMTTVHT